MLFADDNEDFRDLLAEGLRLLGFDVDAHANGDALKEAVLAATPPFVILTDLLMPRCSGFDVIEHLRNHDLVGLIPVVVLSAVSNPEVGPGMLVIEKPVDIDRLAQALDVQVKLAGRYADEARQQLEKIRGAKRLSG